MARWRHILLACLTASALAGCSLLPGSGDKEPAFTSTGYVPEVGTCFMLDAAGPINRTGEEPVDCGQQHSNEVVDAGEFSAEPVTDADMTDAYTRCDKAAQDHFHAIWQDYQLDRYSGWLTTRITTAPTARQAGGERWWDCSLFVMDDAIPLAWRGSLSNALPYAERIGCRRAGSSIGFFTDTSETCTNGHNGEYAGSATVPAGTPYPGSWEQTPVTAAACQRVVADYVGVEKSQARVYAFPVHAEAEWPFTLDLRCFVFTGDRNMTGSAKNSKGAGVPW